MNALTDECWDVINSALGQLEQSWKKAINPPFPELPPLDEDSRRWVLVELIAVDQECRWRNGDRKIVEQYLGEWPELKEHRDLLKELVEAECSTRAIFDSLPTRDELRTRFPQAAELVDLESIAVESNSDRSSGKSGFVWDTVTSAPKEKHYAQTNGYMCSVPPLVLPIGHRLGSYEIVDFLGKGGMGTVYLAKDLDLFRQVAIKIPHREQFHSEKDTERFLAEAATVARQKHPGIVPIHHLGRDEDGKPFIVMEYVEGTSLDKLLKSESLCPERSASLMIEIAEAVHYAHQQGFIHRDLKPANILLDKEGHPHVVDFGLAVHESVQRGKAGECAGTLAYMAPEQVRGDVHHLDGRADVWSLGVMLYEMLAGRHPFVGDSFARLSDEILNREAKPPRQSSHAENIPAELETVCLKCLAKNPSDRYPTSADLARDLQRWMHPRSNLRWVALAFGVAVIISLIAVNTGLLWQNNHHARPTATTAKVLSGNMNVLIWNPEDSSRRGLSLHDPLALPLRPHDQIRIEAELNRPAYLYLVWIDSRGIASPVYPWQPGMWEKPATNEKPVAHVSLPEQVDEGWPMTGPEGMETLVLLARDEPLPADVDLSQLIGNFPPMPVQDSRALVWFADGKVIFKSQDAERGPNFFDPQQIDDPVLKTQREIQEKLSPYFKLHRAVSFASRGE